MRKLDIANLRNGVQLRQQFIEARSILGGGRGSSIRLFVYSSIRLFVYSSIRLFVYSSIRLFVYSSIRLFVYSSIRLFALFSSIRPFAQDPPARCAESIPVPPARGPLRFQAE